MLALKLPTASVLRSYVSKHIRCDGQSYGALFSTCALTVIRQVSSLKCRRMHLWIGWFVDQLEHCHRLYVRSRRPRRIILMRHAESEGNVDKGVYTSTPDHALKITELGRRQVTWLVVTRVNYVLIAE